MDSKMTGVIKIEKDLDIEEDLCHFKVEHSDCEKSDQKNSFNREIKIEIEDIEALRESLPVEMSSNRKKSCEDEPYSIIEIHENEFKKEFEDIVTSKSCVEQLPEQIPLNGIKENGFEDDNTLNTSTDNEKENSRLEPYSIIEIHEDEFKKEYENAEYENTEIFKTHEEILPIEKTSTESGSAKFNECQKVFKIEKSLIMHKRRNHGAKILECGICNKSFNRPYRYRRHKIVHENNWPYTCQICSKQFKYSDSFKRHQQVVHSKEKQSQRHLETIPEFNSSPHKCYECRKAFKSKKTLVTHMKSHGPKNFKCEICNKSFSMLYRYRRHKVIHQDERPYSCEFCPKKFKLPYCVKRHYHEVHPEKKVSTQKDPKTSSVEISKGLKNFVCEVCNKSFTTVGLLRQHKIIHEDKWPYSCQLCPKKFKSQGQLKVHQRAHITDKPFQCEMCGKLFADEYYLKRHKRNVHENKIEKTKKESKSLPKKTCQSKKIKE